MMKTNINLLDLDNDKKKIIKDLDNQIAILKSIDKTGYKIGYLIHSKLDHNIFSSNEILDFWWDRNLMLKLIEKDKKYKCIFLSDELENNINEDD